MPVVGFLSASGRNDRHNLAEAFRRGLSETGFAETCNVTIEKSVCRISTRATAGVVASQKLEAMSRP